MEEKLRKLFDYQKFENNKRLADMISQAENQGKRELSLDELEEVSAAGNTDIKKQKEYTDGKTLHNK